MIPPAMKYALDALASAVGIVLAWASPVNIISALTIIYWTVRIYETDTVKGWFGRGNRP